MPEQNLPDEIPNTKKLFYGWIIVAVCTLMVAISYGLMNSYGVFFKPIADYFNWDRSTLSFVYSASVVIRGAVAIGIGWLADRYGSFIMALFCGFMIGLGLILSSQIHSIWQFFITYGVIEAIGLSGAFGLTTAITSRWFLKNRGLALGIVSSGAGMGTLSIVPVAERLINAFGWSQAFIICGVSFGVITTSTAFLLRTSPPDVAVPIEIRQGKEVISLDYIKNRQASITFGQALKDSRTLLFIVASLLFFFSVQMIMVHLVNYVTDIGISRLEGASIISVIGAISIAGRLSTGICAGKIGLHNTMIITGAFLLGSMICLMFSKSLLIFYFFGIIFGLSYGGEVPLIPLFFVKYWGTKNLATLVGFCMFAVSIGGAVSPWIAGKIYDSTQSYQNAFIVGTIVALASLVLVLLLKSRNGTTE